jgi:ABC-2 type transport system permease protein
MSLLSFELKLFWQNGLNKSVLITYLLAGIIAIMLGQVHYDKEYGLAQQGLDHYLADSQHHFDQTQADQSRVEYMGYYLFHPVFQPPNPWSVIFKGERDETASHLRIRLLGLQSQVNTTPLNNVEARQYGHFDLAFLWLYLMPLLLAVMCINIVADEKSTGRWPMLVAQVADGRRLILKKMAIPAMMIAMLNTVLLIMASLLTDITINGQWWQVLSLVLMYQLFWCLLCGWIVFLNKKASFNYLSFMCFWLVFTFVLPGLTYFYQIKQQHAGADAGLVFEQRQYMNDSWDKDKQADFAYYLKQFPQWSDTAELGEKFDWRWYYGQQHMSDVVVADLVENRTQTKLASYYNGLLFSWLSPVMTVQYGFNRLAHTDGLENVSFNAAIRQYHQQLRNFFWPFYFSDTVFTEADYERMPTFNYQENTTSNNWVTLFKLVILCAVFWGVMIYQMRRFKEQ